MKYIYVAGPMTKGDLIQHVRNAVEAGDRCRTLGLTPYVPHLSVLSEFILPKSYKFWIDLDLDWVRRCDAVLRLPGESKGADQEVDLARTLGLPVFYGNALGSSATEIRAWASQDPSTTPSSPSPSPNAGTCTAVDPNPCLDCPNPCRPHNVF